MEMKDIDLTKCNNCRYRAKIDGIVTTGIVSAKDGMNAFLKNEQGHNAGCLTEAGLVDLNNNPITDFEIVPRDPETYQDWQVGDVIRNSDGKAADGRIIFRSGEFVAADVDGCVCYTCQELFDMGYRLVLTDIELQIIEEERRYEPQDGDICFVRAAGSRFVFVSGDGRDANALYDRVSISLGDGHLYIAPGVPLLVGMDSADELRPATEEEKRMLFDAMAKAGKRWNAEEKVVEDIPKPYEFRKGEPVLARNSALEKWCICVYMQAEGTTNKVFVGEAEAFFVEVIPYNEETMHLLGTSEDYKEDEK